MEKIKIITIPKKEKAPVANLVFVCSKFHERWPISFRDIIQTRIDYRQTDRQTDKQTEKLITISPSQGDKKDTKTYWKGLFYSVI